MLTGPKLRMVGFFSLVEQLGEYGLRFSVSGSLVFDLYIVFGKLEHIHHDVQSSKPKSTHVGTEIPNKIIDIF